MTASSQWRLAWDERPWEEATNLNPAFCSEIIGLTVGEYHRLRTLPLNLTVAFLILPLTLHEKTRRRLPQRANATLVGWIAKNNPVLVELPHRARALRPITREALIFSLTHEILAFSNGGLVPGEKPVHLAARHVTTTDDTERTRRAAGLLGRWFSYQSTQSSILAGMGVTP